MEGATRSCVYELIEACTCLAYLGVRPALELFSVHLPVPPPRPDTLTVALATLHAAHVNQSMLHITSRASRLAITLTKQTPSPLQSRKLLVSIPWRIRYFGSTERIASLRDRTTQPFRRHIVAQAVRHCSYQRMCKAHADIAGASMDVSKGREVLPTNVKPVHYDLTLEPDFEKFSYEGTVVIEYVGSKIGP